MKRTVQITQIALFAALTAVFSQISFPVPMTPIVFTMGVMAVYLTAALLPKWQAFLALIVYLLLGAIGLPGIQRVSRRNRYPAGAHRWVSDGLSHHGVFGRMAPGAVGQNAAAPVCFLPDCAADYHYPLLPHRFPVVYAGGTGGLDDFFEPDGPAFYPGGYHQGGVLGLAGHAGECGGKKGRFAFRKSIK